jgi:hypothetical protein
MKNNIFKAVMLGIGLMAFESCVQDMECERFKEGTFKVSYDSFSNQESKIIRKEDIQTEFDSLGNKTNLSVNWIGNCSYYLSYVSGDRKLGKKELEILSKPDAMLVEFINIKSDTLEFKIIIPYLNQRFEKFGKMIKVED